MPRWEPGTRDRLERAALELFTARGYDEVTVQDIARHAGLGKATFFRTFPDKREVLFWGQDLLADLLSEGITTAPSTATIAEQLRAALQAVATAFPDDRHELAAAREAVVAGHVDLQERLAYKRSVLRDAIRAALLERGAHTTDATIAAEIGRAAFSATYERWAAAETPTDFATLADEELRALLDATRRISEQTGAPVDNLQR